MYDGQEIEHGGHRFRVTFPHDDTMGPPWKEHGGHGPVSEWTRRRKRSGEVTLVADYPSYLYYDFAAAMRIAKRDGWGAADTDRARWVAAGATPSPGMIAHSAVKADIQRLRDWCLDHWSWIGVVVTLLDDGGDPMDASASLWGIESDAGEYLEEIARELADEIIARLSKSPDIAA